MRLLSGILAAQPFTSRLIGDASLSRRPMRRIIEPLTELANLRRLTASDLRNVVKTIAENRTNPAEVTSGVSASSRQPVQTTAATGTIQTD
jgi:5-enolpyruvylshikimate-3-phosphate synthase